MKVKVTLQDQSSNGNISCPHYNFKIVQDFFIKLCTNIRHDQTTCSKKNRNINFRSDIIVVRELVVLLFVDL